MNGIAVLQAKSRDHLRLDRKTQLSRGIAMIRVNEGFRALSCVRFGCVEVN